MATYKNMADFQKKFSLSCIRSRTDFLHSIKWASLQSTDPYPDHPSLKGILFAMHSNLLPEEYTCKTCGGSFHLRCRLRADRQSWDWTSHSRACDDCARTSQSLTSGTVLQGIKAKNFLNFFDCLCMWSFDYPSWIITREAGVWHQQLNQWEEVFHQAVNADLWHYATSFSLTSTPLKSANHVRKIKKTVMKKHSATIKRPSASSSTVMKKPSGACKRPAGNKRFKPHSQKKTPDAMSFYKKYKYVVEVDESHLNKLRSGALTKSCRAETDQVWVWGATVPGRPERFIFRVLDHPQDAMDGKPRGQAEILDCLRLLNLQPKTIIVTDGWKATIAAIKDLRKEKGWTNADLWHEIVNHSAGEITNSNGFTTNHIENRWSLVKRWIRKREGGRLPSHSNRQRWKCLLNEYRWRKMHTKGSKHVYVVPLTTTMEAMQRVHQL